MSGHSHAKNVARKKESGDQKKAASFSKLLKAITIAARAGDPNPDFNPTLRAAVDKAKSQGVPKDNIARALNKNSSESADLEEVIMEAYGPDGIALLIIAITDNSNRTVSETKHLLNLLGAKWAEPGSVKWAFRQLPDHSWQANFPQSVSPDLQLKLKNIKDQLEAHDDIQIVHLAANL